MSGKNRYGIVSIGIIALLVLSGFMGFVSCVGVAQNHPSTKIWGGGVHPWDTMQNEDCRLKNAE